MLLFFGLLAIILGIVMLCIIPDYNNLENFWCAMLCIFGGVLVSLSITKIKQEKLPTPLDVYRGKTTLEITYRDSIAIDSIVVFKNK